MTYKIRPKRSNVASKVPVAGDLDIGELAINMADQKIYTKTPSNAIVELGGGGAAGSSAWADITGKPNFANVATSGSYNDLSNKPSLFSGSYNDLTSKPTIPTNLDSLTDVTITSATNGQVLKFNGTAWVNGTDSTSGGNPFDQDLNTTDDVIFNKLLIGEIDSGKIINDALPASNGASDKITLWGPAPESGWTYGIGVEAENMWFNLPNQNNIHGFKWYAEGNQILRLRADGRLELAAGADIVDSTGNSVLGGGTPGADGASAYDIAVTNGFVGNEAAWLASLVGAPGADGNDGAPGADGNDGAPGADGNDGAPGQGVPTGGTAGQVLAKIDSTDYSTEWITPTGGSGPTNEITNTDGVDTWSVSVGTDGVVTMTTARGGIEFGAQPEPGGPTHFHIMRPAGAEGATDLYFGDDYNYVKMPALYGTNPTTQQGVEIGSSLNEGTVSVWKFGTDGDLVLPAGGDILDSNGNSVLGGGASGFTTATVAGQDDILAAESGNTLEFVAGEGIAITTNENDGTITISASGGSGLEAPYKGFRAHYGTMYNNTDDENGPINKLVIYKSTVTPASAIDTSTESDDFQVTGLTGSDVVAMLVVVTDGTDWDVQTPTATLKTFVEKIIDEVILDEGVEGDVNTVSAMKLAFYNNFSNFGTVIPNPKVDLEFFDVNNQFNISPEFATGDGANFGSISYNMSNDTLDLGNWGQGLPNTHEVGDVHVIPGNTIQDANSNFLLTPDNDVTVTITGVSGGAIQNYTVTGTLPRPAVIWPNSIEDGGDDEYDGANAIHTDLATDISYNDGNVVTSSSAFGGGNYVVTYQAGIFGVFATDADIGTIGTSGDSGGYGNDSSSSGFDGDGVAVTGSLYGESNEVSLGDFVFTGSTMTATDDDLYIKAVDDLWLDALQDDIHIRANDDVRIKVGYDFTADIAQQEWRFDTDGSITFPDNTIQTTAYTGGGTGNVTFNDQAVIGTGDQYGSSGLYLAPGTESVGNLQYWRVRGGDVATHMHFDTGNNAYFDQYFGDDVKYVKLEAAGNVKIGSDDANGNSASWTFGTDGNLTLPEDTTISDTSEIVAVTLDQFTDGGYPGTQVFNKVSDTLYELSPGGPTMALVSGIWRIMIGPGAYYSSTDLITWTAVAGSLPAPVGTLTRVSTMNLTVGSKVWAFDEDGNLTTPSNLVIGPGAGSGSSILQYNDTLQIVGEGANSAVLMGWTANTSAPDSVASIAMNYPSGGEGNILIAVGNNATTVNYWLFDNTGNLTLPSGGDIVDSTGTSVLGGGTTLPADASGYLVNDGAGALSWAAGDGTFSGDYDDLTNKPTIPADVSDLTDTTNLLFSGSYNDLSNTPALFDGDYTNLTNTPALFDGDYTSLANTPSLFSGDYDDLTNKPALFDGAYSSLTGTPSLFSGDYDDLTSKPTLFDGNYNSLTNKPTYKEAVSTGTGPGGNNQADSLVLAGLNPTENIPSTYGGDLILKGGYGGANNDLFGEVRIKSGTIGSNFEWHFTVDKKIKLPSGGDIVNSTGTSVLFSGSYADLTNKPTIPADVSDLTDTTSLLFSGSYNDLTNTPTILAEPAFTIKIANFTATAGARYGVNTTSNTVTATLPASPAAGDAIWFADAGGAYATNNLIINPGSNTIMSASGTMTVSINDQSFGLFYNGTTWRVY